ncbi:uncharacterized protein [Blastocystis hominis]|uniref:Aldose 1-epimerase n=1 Tax=Blastocystis hominis TaxID=12968 RepID=D8M109_BLAHO|nr:uncharacterized protein [Blastocystis hominis]CBK21748.2 unnamed protein product [Blastocystis hominis]|eukprot:XP_012895796.1 uncharacterized protein [Blastocystis hominis]
MNRTTLDDIVHKSDYFGSTIGRNAFRIANGQFTLNGTHYQLATNSGSNHNHGGRIGFDKCMWDAEITTHADRVSITFSRYSADKEEGYPGALHVRATYSITSSNELDMVFEASGNEIPTIVNMTNHAYWNLSGNCKRPVNNHKLCIDSDFYLDGENMIPNETPIPVKDTLMDFTTLKSLSPAIDRVDGGGRPGIDHAFCLRGYSNDIDNKTLRNVARYVNELKCMVDWWRKRVDDALTFPRRSVP